MTAGPHFSLEAAGEPSAPGRFVSVDAVEPVAFVDGLDFRPVLGEQTMVNFVSFQPHTEAPEHVHAEEQIVIVLQGEFDFVLDGETRTMRPGDVAVVPPWVRHGAFTRESSCQEVDVFNPPRATLIEHARARQAGTGGARAPGHDVAAGPSGAEPA
jgi:quercetin dioxygenase-like cupin family protein